MVSQTPQIFPAQRLFGFCLLISLMLFLVSTSQAQMGGIDPDPGSPGTGGRNTIEGRIYYPSGRNVDKRFKIRLTGIRGGDFFTMSDDSGAFSFRRVAGGTYTVTVEAQNDYESAIEQVDVIDTVSSRGTMFGRSYNLQIRLSYKKGSENPGVVDVALLAAPKSAVELYQKALQSEQAGDNEKAIDQLQRAIALHPRFALAFNKLGVIYQRLGSFDQAEKALASAVEISPEVFEIRLNYGVVLLSNRHYAKAETQLLRATEMRSSSAAPHLFRGKTLIHLKRYSEAESELRQVIKLGGEDVALAYRFLGALYNEQGEVKQALEALEKYLSLAPGAKDADNVRQIMKQLRAQSVKT